MATKNSLTDLEGIRIGHATDTERMTGCTVVLFDPDALGGVFVRGTAAGTRQIDSLFPRHFVERLQGVFLTGGSAFGLDATAGVMRYMEEQGRGLDVLYARVPIVPTAVIFDLSLGDHLARPSAEMAYQACRSAGDGRIEEGSVGAGTGASVGKLYGIDNACKGGLGTCSRVFSDGLVVAALTVVNAYGDVVEPSTGKVLAGARDPSDPTRFCNAGKVLADRGEVPEGPFTNTVLSIVATNAALSKVEACRLARSASVGISRAVSPAHALFDGDVVFAVSTGSHAAEPNSLAGAAVELVSCSILRAVREADGFGLIPAWKDLEKGDND